jgi:peptidoglycan lytic transglycosylase G
VVERRAHVRRLALVLAGVALAAAGCSGGEKKQAAPPPPPPPPKPLRIIFPEGFTRRDMAQRVTAVDAIARSKRHVSPRLSARAYLRLTSGKVRVPSFGRRPYEGFLFPATYDFFKRTPTKKLVHDQLETFSENWAKVDLRYARKKNLTPYDVLTIASMVEKEAQAPRERPLVAAVIYNRLRNRMPLGMDSTIRYALDVPPTESLHESQLRSDNPYNTRIRAGLPPTPIANPGLASIRAAARPAKVDYLYFVRKPDHVHHFFTSSYRDFQNYANTHGY